MDTGQQKKNEALSWLNECFHKPGWRREVFDLQSAQSQATRKPYGTPLWATRCCATGHPRDGSGHCQCKQPYAGQYAPGYDAKNPIYHIGILNMINSRWKFTVCDTENALLLTSYALQAYHAEHGHYPDKLSELAPDYLPAIPDDPFAANKPVCYKRTGAKFLLYSIGPDGSDDGGKASCDGQANSKPPNEVLWPTSLGDIVAGVNIR